MLPETVPVKRKPRLFGSTLPVKLIRPWVHGFWIHAPFVSVHVCVAFDQLPVRLNTPLHLVAADPTMGKKSALAAVGHVSTMIRRPVYVVPVVTDVQV